MRRAGGLGPGRARARESHGQAPQALTTSARPRPRAGGHVDPPVLIGVLKDRRDLALLREQRWYRIPARHAPARPFGWLAFYQPAAFGRTGRGIRFFAVVRGRRLTTRRELLPGEPDHPRAGDAYWRYETGPLLRLPRPLRNLTPRRLTFAYTTLRRLFAARELFGVFTAPPLEQLVARGLRRAGIPALRELTVASGPTTRFRLDFAVFCTKGGVAVECDADDTHGTPDQRARDRRKDAVLRRLGWRVVRLRERAILSGLRAAIARVTRAVRAQGGPAVR